MISPQRELFELFGRLDTWIVGLQYYDGAGAAANREVVFEREPDNPFDANAIAVFATDGTQAGHLPRYDAAYFAPLMDEGVIALKGRAGESERGGRLPLTLEIYATTKVSDILARDPRNDWRAIYHNLFVGLWDRLDDYSSATLQEFRDRFRSTARDHALYPKTQFLYRMLKARIADLEKQEETRLREQVLAAIAAMRFGRVTGWPEMTVIAIDADGPATPATAAGAGASALSERVVRRSDVLRQLPTRCPYPAGARGAVVLVHGEWFSLDWFDAAECAEVYWYPMILSAVEQALRDPRGQPEGNVRTAEEVQAAILGTLANAACSMSGGEEEGGGDLVAIRAGIFAGDALFRDRALARLRIREAETETVRDTPGPTHEPQRLNAAR